MKILVLLLGILGCASSVKVDKRPCSLSNAALTCLHDNFETMFQQYPESFWAILRSNESEIRRCGDTLSVRQFLELAEVKLGNSEFNEYFAEIIEKHLLKEPECFLHALQTTNSRVRGVVLRDLKTPLFIEPREIARTLRRYRERPEYHDMLAAYFEEK